MMKHFLKIILLAAVLGIYPCLTHAQEPPHPEDKNPESGGGSTVGGPSGGAPIGNGTYMLVMLAAMYAGRKAFELKLTTEESI